MRSPKLPQSHLTTPSSHIRCQPLMRTTSLMCLTRAKYDRSIVLFSISVVRRKRPKDQSSALRQGKRMGWWRTFSVVESNFLGVLQQARMGEPKLSWKFNRFRSSVSLETKERSSVRKRQLTFQLSGLSGELAKGGCDGLDCE